MKNIESLSENFGENERRVHFIIHMQIHIHADIFDIKCIQQLHEHWKFLHIHISTLAAVSSYKNTLRGLWPVIIKSKILLSG